MRFDVLTLFPEMFCALKQSILGRAQENEKIEDLSCLTKVTEELTRTMEKTRIAEYVDYLEHPFRLLWMNFLIGMARGLGSTIGLAIVLAILVFFIQKLIMLNLPGISDFIADLIVLIQEQGQLLK